MRKGLQQDVKKAAVIGAGPGGYVAAIRAAQLGMKVALIEERATLGGTCLNVGCVPSKALLESSELFKVTRDRLGEHGITAAGVEMDVAGMMERKARIVTEVTDGLGLLMKKNKIKVINGRGVLAGGKKIISSTEALELTAVPGRMVVVGGGAIGLELGSVWKRLGAEVTHTFYRVGLGRDDLRVGMVVVPQRFGDRVNPHLHRSFMDRRPQSNSPASIRRHFPWQWVRSGLETAWKN